LGECQRTCQENQNENQPTQYALPKRWRKITPIKPDEAHREKRLSYIKQYSEISLVCANIDLCK